MENRSGDPAGFLENIHCMVILAIDLVSISQNPWPIIGYSENIDGILTRTSDGGKARQCF